MVQKTRNAGFHYEKIRSIHTITAKYRPISRKIYRNREMWCNMESKNDSIMLIMGVAVLLIALMGTAVFEGEPPSGNAFLFDVYYSDHSQDIVNLQDYTGEGESDMFTTNFTGPLNITRIEFEFTWIDDDTSEANVGGLGVQNQPDSFRLTVLDPSGEEQSDEAESDISSEEGIIVLTFEFMEIVQNKTENSSSSAEALSEEITTMNGIGSWIFTIECLDAGNSETTTGQTTAQDDGNDWNLRVTAFYYEAKIEEHVIATE